MSDAYNLVATVLTACGIETVLTDDIVILTIVATVLTACGIETYEKLLQIDFCSHNVATVLTACGIETS